VEGQRSLTVYSDRGLVDPAADEDSARPGIQLTLDTAGGLGTVPLRAAPSGTEGESTLYLEYVDPVSALVTAAGGSTFALTADQQAPTVLWSLPQSDCTALCLGQGEPLVFRFSEPLAAASVRAIKVERLSGTACDGNVLTDLSGASSTRYDALARTLRVTPPSQAASDYAVRVTLPAMLTDAAATANALAPFVRCARVGSLTPPAAPLAPFLVAVDHDQFSPDGDGSLDTVTWLVRVDDDSRLLELRVSRAGRELWVLDQPIAGAGQYAISWDGSDAGARIVDDGAYRFDLTAYSRAGAISSARTGFVTVARPLHMVSVERRY
jgi:hypothetical protein